MLRKLTSSPIFTKLLKPILRPLYWTFRGTQKQNMRVERERQLQPVIERERTLLSAARHQHPDDLYRAGEPLVTVIIPTYQRGELLVQRTLPAVLNQTYQHLDVVIVGDHCTDNTAELLANYPDPRVRFYNLPTRPAYPTNKEDRWRVAGVPPVNHALEMARGEWFAHCDDDDIWTLDHVAVLLRQAQKNNLEFVYGLGKLQISATEWEDKGRATPGAHGRVAPFVSHSAVLYRGYLRLFPYDIEAWKYRQGADANRWMRMSRAGVRMGFVDHLVVHMPLRPQEVTREINTPE